jgi:hypothetical protein
MKSVPNLISYLHDFFQNFSQSLAICFELFSFGVIFNPSLAPPASRQPTSPVAAPSRPSHGPKPCRPDCRRAAPTASRRSSSRRAAISAPVSRRSPPSPLRRRRAVVGSPCSAAVARSRRAPHTRAVPAPHCASGPSVVSAQRHSN